MAKTTDEEAMAQKLVNYNNAMRGTKGTNDAGFQMTVAANNLIVTLRLQIITLQEQVADLSSRLQKLEAQKQQPPPPVI